MTQTSERPNVWGVPLALGALTLTGLLSALLGEHFIWKAACWVAMAVPVVVGLWYAGPRRAKR